MNRHRVGIGEAVLIICVVFIAGFVVFEYEFGDSISGEKQVDFQEMIGLGILFVGCTICFGWRRIVEQEREIVRRITAESRAHELANTDALTGLANRRQFERVLKETVASPPGAGRVHAVLALDLNKFKRINDVYGHLMGDDVLVVVAQRLSAAMRDGDLLARLGGDEFAVIARHLSGAEGATSVAGRILKALESPIEVGSNRHRVGVGIGLALVPDDGTNVEEIGLRAGR